MERPPGETTSRVMSGTRTSAETTIGRFELLQRLGGGGMAEVFLARATGIGGFEKRVVVKRLLSHLAYREDYVRMFFDEGRLGAQLLHPNIAQIYDVGIHDSRPYLVLEYVPGKDLRQILRALRERGGKLPLAHSLTIAVDVAAALHAAHEQRGPDGRSLNVVHRDVSPSNVIVSFDGCVKLIDFGIAKSSTQEKTTRTGVSKGTVPYMAPEQCLATGVDQRSDVYGLGALVFELTTGTRTLSPKDAFESMRRIVRGDIPRPSSRVSGYPADLESIVTKALSRSPSDRYASALDMQADLESFADRSGTPRSRMRLASLVRELFPAECPRGRGEPPPVPPPHPCKELRRRGTGAKAVEFACEDTDIPIVVVTHNSDEDPTVEILPFAQAAGAMRKGSSVAGLR